MKRDKQLLVVAVVLLLIAGGLFLRHYSASQESFTKPPTQADIEKRITDIQNDPHMPAIAKEIAIGQIRAHTQSGHR
jgi:hypothetical protein